MTDWTITALKEYIDTRLGDTKDHWAALSESLSEIARVRDEDQDLLLQERFDAQEKALSLAMQTTSAAAAEAVAAKQAMLFMTREAAEKDQKLTASKFENLEKLLDEVRIEQAKDRGKKQGVSAVAAAAALSVGLIGTVFGIVMALI